MIRFVELEECPRGRRAEPADALDLVVEFSQARKVPLDGEVGDGPDDFAKEEDDGADVEELELEALVLAADDLEASGERVVPFDVVVSAVGWLERSEEVLGELDVCAAANMLCEVGAAGSEHASDLRPVDRGGMATAHDVERAIGEWQRRIFGVGNDDDAQGR